jgi:hypothetical protein
MTVPQIPRRHSGAETLVTAAKIAARWQVHRDTIYRLAESELPYVKLGPATRRYRWQDVLDYEAAHLVGGG